MKQVPFAGSRGAGKYFQVSDEDFEAVSQQNWYLTKSGYVHPAVHRFIMKPPRGMVVDHIDHDPLNNCRTNLRVCTNQQNSWNRARAKNKTGLRGVTSHYSKIFKVTTYKATIACIGGGTRTIGFYTTPKDAARAYNDEAARLRGEYAALNELSDDLS